MFKIQTKEVVDTTKIHTTKIFVKNNKETLTRVSISNLVVVENLTTKVVIKKEVYGNINSNAERN